MKILSLESSAVSAAACLTDGEKLIASAFQNNGLTHSRTLLPLAANVLESVGLKPADVDAFAVAAGPGSFTGLRIGVATVKGLALGTDKPCVGVSTLEAMAQASIVDVENYIHSCGFYRQKAKDIVLACQMLIEKFDSKVPDTMDKLLSLPGVGRKTANLLLGDLYGVPGSVVCDTHCIRICGRLGLSKGKEPEKVEKQLRKILPPEESSDFCHRIVLFGRDTCIARNPKCGECPLSPFCNEVR